MADVPFSVSALTQRIAASLEGFGPLLVQGELSMVKVAPSGHLYATLKDSGAVIGLVMWRSAVVRNGGMPREGERVTVRGSLSVYGPRGQYQLTATRIAPIGQGDLAARFEELKSRLLAEGLFDAERKRPLPLLPRAVGLATAAGSAALADLLHSIRGRFPRMHVVHAPCQVQGLGAADSIVHAIQRLERHGRVDVIIAGRGGGSLEDLQAFNDESVVRAIAGCAVPLVSAVGHETDTTLADFAADVRAKTPTAAAELIVPVESELLDRLSGDHAALDRAMEGAIDDARLRLASAARHRAMAMPGHRLAMARQRLDEQAMRIAEDMDDVLTRHRRRNDDLDARLRAQHPRQRIQRQGERLRDAARHLRLHAARHLDTHRDHLAARAGRLDALSPLAVIARGYSVVRTPDGTLVRRIADAIPGSPIEARVIDGWIQARVEGGRGQRLNEPESPYDAAPPPGSAGASPAPGMDDQSVQ